MSSIDGIIYARPPPSVWPSLHLHIFTSTSPALASRLQSDPANLQTYSVLRSADQLQTQATQVPPAFFKISDLAPDRGILQSELFTSRSQNLVLAKLQNSGFWRYGQFFKWNRVKMAKNDQKRVDIFWGASHMINDNIFNIFSSSTFSLGYFTNPAFWLNFKKIALETGSRNTQGKKLKN